MADLRLVAPISTEDLGATTRDIHAKTGALRALREARAAIITKR